ncbi:MAG: hypothetical protein R3F29_08960 [Planctomycetota bacterium]
MPIPTSLSGTDGTVSAVCWWDPDGAGPAPEVLVLGGSFSVAGTANAANIAVFDPVSDTFAALGGGVNGVVLALTVSSSGELVAAGEFTAAGGASASRIARWNGSSWAPLGAGCNARVRALTVLPGGELVAAGDFLSAGGIACARVAKWSGAQWQAMGAGLASIVYDLVVLTNGDLVAGGQFGYSGTTPANRVARWNGTAWSTLGSGVGYTVTTMAALPNGALIVGGSNQVSLWNGAAWQSPAGWSPFIQDLVSLPNGHVVEGISWGDLREWDGVGFTVIGNADGSVNAMAVTSSGDLAVGGTFSAISGTTGRGIITRESGLWNSPGGVAAPVTATELCALPGDAFVATDGQTLWRHGAGVWSVLGSANAGYTVDALAVLPAGDIVAGGRFTSIAGVPMGGLGRWDGTTWSPLGSVTGGSARVECLIVLPDGDLVASGSFAAIDGVSAQSIARWNGATWAPMGGFGTVANVTGLALDPDGQLYAAGEFWVAGGAPADAVARWDGLAWQPVGNTGGSGAYCIAALSSGELLIGGDPMIGQTQKRWNGTSWVNWIVSDPNSPVVAALHALPGGGAAIGGQFDWVMGATANNVARYQGGAFSAFGLGVNAWVAAFATADNGDLLVAGAFGLAGGQTSPGVARITTNCPATVASHGVGCVGTQGQATLEARTLPWAGETLRTQGAGLGAIAVLAAGFTSITPGTVSLVGLLPNVAPGCELLVDPALIGLQSTNGGIADAALPLPASASVIGASFFQQMIGLTLDPTLQIAEVVSSNALSFVVGRF